MSYARKQKDVFYEDSVYTALHTVTLTSKLSSTRLRLLQATIKLVSDSYLAVVPVKVLAFRPQSESESERVASEKRGKRLKRE